MSKTPVFVSFDYDNDKTLKDFLIEQSRKPDSPFEVVDHSIKVEVPRDWEAAAEKRIVKSKVVLVMVGPHTHTAQGVNKEVSLARKHEKKVVQIIGYNNSSPTPVKNAGVLYSWNWPNLKNILQ